VAFESPPDDPEGTRPEPGEPWKPETMKPTNEIQHEKQGLREGLAECGPSLLGTGMRDGGARK
jgi:hypothetical protein